MSLRQSLPANRNLNAESSLENEGTPTCASNVTTAPTHTLSGRDSVKLLDENESSLTETSGGATPNYIYYRIYTEDGAIPSKTPASPGDPFLGRIKARSVPPPHTVKAVKHSIAKVEDIKDRESTSLFLTSCSQSPMGNADKVNIRSRTGPGSTSQEPLALVAKMSDSERSALESGRRGGLTSDATPPDLRYLYYLLYADEYENPSKVAFDPKEPCLGRIRVDSVAPPHSPASIKRCISRVEETPELAHADLFADTSCYTPLKEGHISILSTDGPGLGLDEPMAIVQVPVARLESPSFKLPDGRYIIKNRAVDIYWNVILTPVNKVFFWPTPPNMNDSYLQCDITHDSNGNIFISSPSAQDRGSSSGSWVGADITGSTVPVPWRLIPADGKFCYLTTDVNRISQNPRVPAVPGPKESYAHVEGSMATLKEGDQYQMWEFIPN